MNLALDLRFKVSGSMSIDVLGSPVESSFFRMLDEAVRSVHKVNATVADVNLILFINPDRRESSNPWTIINNLNLPSVHIPSCILQVQL